MTPSLVLDVPGCRSVDKGGSGCAATVYNHPLVPSAQITSLQGVQMNWLPVDVATLVYAGKRPSYPQSTALITAIDIHTSDRCNAPFHHTMRHQP